MNKIVKVNHLTFGEGTPKVCIPIVERTQEFILQEAALLEQKPCDLIEWRADYYEDLMVKSSLIDTLDRMLKVLSKPILFTIRTKKEGGEIELDQQKYEEILRWVIESELVSLVDVEYFQGDELVLKLVECAHSHHVVVIGSNHDFSKTPSTEQIMTRLCNMSKLGIDLPKIAVMPQSKEDVVKLLVATYELSLMDDMPPIITMSMGNLGIISRISGETFGSCMTFATNQVASAPGQIPVGDMNHILGILDGKV